MTLNPLLSAWASTRNSLQRRFAAGGYSCYCCKLPTCSDTECPGRPVALQQSEGGERVDTGTLQRMEPAMWAVIAASVLAITVSLAVAARTWHWI